MPVIEISHLRKVYGEKVAVDDVSLTVEKGEIFGILGPNGAGKTTTVECVVGLRRRDAGSVNVLGLDPLQDRRALTNAVGVQLQEAALPEKMTVGEAITLYSTFYDSPRDGRELLVELGVQQAWSTPYRKLSGGQKQRLSIALALLGNPQIAVLDELTTGLDPAARRETWSLIERVRDSGVTILLVTHLMEEAQRLCDRLAIIARGRVVALDSPAAIAAMSTAPHTLRLAADGRDLSSLQRLPSVESVHRDGGDVVVVGGAELAQEVLTQLSADGVIARDVRLQQATLDDAFVAITGNDPDASAEPHTEKELV
ncbi:ATP-binding cassette domain-containing protein [Epidermidibacterium keratini]|uniref:ATP-binding cassette domain-containing protein n=1 Tax=Epidermidibacterium keratini TaxID=1891644 RepID=A0A7L4YLX7_9ACTN|nr:ABC transporter ATP-binding protein [Epidermidibacterium keratini]QHB99833.1 ATP-binding cassette domain-containing protein [Epidermidibacterium keratini]